MMQTPISKTRKERATIIPPTPQMERIGYGTGVGVYRMIRSPANGAERSPWAVKKLTNSISRNIEKRLADEAEILKKLDHPNIVGFRAFVNSVDRKCLVMEQCEKSLEELLEQSDSSLPADVIKKVALDIAKALDYLHTKGLLLHGDIKSSNILIKGNFECAKLCDFGVSQQVDDKGHGIDDHYVGTDMWSAPEVLPNGCGPVTTKADIFSYGLVLYEMVALKPPHYYSDESLPTNLSSESNDCMDVFCKEYGTRPTLPELSSQYQQIINLFNWCTESDWNMRPTAREIVEYLESC